MPMSTESCEDSSFLSCLLAMKCFSYGGGYSMCRFRRGDDTLCFREHDPGCKTFFLCNRYCLQKTKLINMGYKGRHSMIAKPAGVYRFWDKVVS